MIYLSDTTVSRTSAHRLHKRGCRRVAPGPDWVASPTTLSEGREAHTHSRRMQMKWTKPEAEVVAVTMEVTAYVATL